MVVQKIARGLEWFVEDVDELSRDISQCSLVGTYEFIMLRYWRHISRKVGEAAE
ncbi:hypothetical protein FOQG_07909 [Fusarium oxysporum f. sp. raphani 54005]|jgi:hypothetical protein|uniref:Uncharacterized protein n=4 Tax=Fusarium oxysporum TaxID=5507 RepID=X0C547_FUSOX|nr:hypothetical protein FOVG_01489 [Fusarium oxysporum f. sp. pisi HDV247]EXK89251.1 hypothetical protein FOQG_07909 [Fusarium oxysporum f. sp. raphani 54005]EXL75999.1 hypothetical protein FOPG_09157 [Fusarium oxysporum f. sp. conglutinans race 2 54008]EXM28609.1 hypothetical protein FOTG_05830 [Fusarium oxysporum f. sp. vasinfectum 25433]